MSLFPYFLEYVKINTFLLYFVLFLIFLYATRFIHFPKNLRSTPLFLAILAVGIVLRVLWISYSSYEPQWDWTTTSNENDWINIHATELTRGIWFHDPDGLPAGRRPIGYPLFLGGLYALFGAKGNVAWCAHLVLFAVTAVLIFLISRRIFGNRAALLSSAFFCFYPISIYSTKLITDEHLFLPLWYFGIYLILRETKGELKWGWLKYGVVFGYSTMIRTHSIFMPAVAALNAWLLKKTWPKVILTGTAVGLVMMMVNSPWVIRNYKAWKVPVLYTLTGCNIYMEMNSAALEKEGVAHIPKMGEPGYSEELTAALSSGDQARAHQLCNREMKRWILNHPADFLYLGTRNLLLLMRWNRSGGVWPLDFQYEEGHFDPSRPLLPETKKRLEEPAFALYYILFFSFLISIPALIAGWKNFSSYSRKGILILGACLFFWLLEHLIIFPYLKYRYPLEPLMIIFASYFWTTLTRRPERMKG